MEEQKSPNATWNVKYLIFLVNFVFGCEKWTKILNCGAMACWGRKYRGPFLLIYAQSVGVGVTLRAAHPMFRVKCVFAFLSVRNLCVPHGKYRAQWRSFALDVIDYAGNAIAFYRSNIVHTHTAQWAKQKFHMQLHGGVMNVHCSPSAKCLFRSHCIGLRTVPGAIRESFRFSISFA